MSIARVIKRERKERGKREREREQTKLKKRHTHTNTPSKNIPNQLHTKPRCGKKIYKINDTINTVHFQRQKKQKMSVCTIKALGKMKHTQHTHM